MKVSELKNYSATRSFNVRTLPFAAVTFTVYTPPWLMDNVGRRRFPLASDLTLGRVMVLPLAVVIRTVNLWPAPVAGMTGVKDSPTKHDTGVTDPIGARVIIRRASSLMLFGVRSYEIVGITVEGFTSSIGG
jgi:hypothetical protein